MLPPREINRWRDNIPRDNPNAPTLLTLPTEVRELIYGFLYSSYTIRRGFGSSSNTEPSSLHRLALLLTCRQIFAEAWRHLPLNCTLHFRGTENLLETLLSVDQSIVTRVRHVHVRAFPFPLYGSGRSEYYPTYYAANAFSLLPGLCLDTLVVEDCWHGFGMGDGWRDVTTYFDIETLLQSDAWRQLTYITPCTDFLASGYDHRRKRQAQPETWNTLLEERDGAGSGAAVEMFITPHKQPSSSPIPWSAIPGHLIAENWRLNTPAQDMKGEVRIVARRSPRARCVQLGITPGTSDSTSDLTTPSGRTWHQLKGKHGSFAPPDWTPYHNDMSDAVGWIYGGWGRRMQLATEAMSS